MLPQGSVPTLFTYSTQLPAAWRAHNTFPEASYFTRKTSVDVPPGSAFVNTVLPMVRVAPVNVPATITFPDASMLIHWLTSSPLPPTLWIHCHAGGCDIS